MARTLLCPSCLHRFSASSILFRCVLSDCIGQVPDEIYAIAHSTANAEMGRILLLPRFRQHVPRLVSCDVCHRTSSTRICPCCHAILNYDAGSIDQYNIAVVGMRASGKTYYLASLISLLQYETGKRFGFTIRMPDEKTRQRWEHDFSFPLFVQKRMLQATVSGQIHEPLILRFTFASQEVRRTLNICFFETMGEDMAVPASRLNSQICLADGLILLLDPLQITSIRQRVSAAVLPPLNPLAAPASVVARLRTLLEQELRLRGRQKVPVPVAFAFSKVDLLTPLLSPGSAMYHPSEHVGYLDRNNVQSVHTEIESYLASWIGPQFSRSLHEYFACYNYFGVSAFGEPPDGQGSVISPLRVEDPFLWILYQLKLIPGMNRL